MTDSPNFEIERTHDGVVCGIDEAGRGPWAGPVVAASVVWPQGALLPDGLHDSKKLSRTKRESLYPLIMGAAIIGVGIATAQEIDQSNILAATKCAMQRAYAAMPQNAATALIDGNQPPQLPCQTVAVVKGDSKSLSIAAASIIAKVTRDRIMDELATAHPHYGWERNAGYGTKEHQDALRLHGVTEHHRASFAPIRKLLEEAA